MTVVGPEQLFEEAVRYARGAEKLMAAMTLLQATSGTLAEAHEVDPELAPELAAALKGLVDVGEALGRAITFLNARIAVKTGQA